MSKHKVNIRSEEEGMRARSGETGREIEGMIMEAMGRNN